MVTFDKSAASVGPFTLNFVLMICFALAPSLGVSFSTMQRSESQSNSLRACAIVSWGLDGLMSIASAMANVSEMSKQVSTVPKYKAHSDTTVGGINASTAGPIVAMFSTRFFAGLVLAPPVTSIANTTSEFCCSKMSCPVVAAIKEIRSGGSYSEDEDGTAIILGGVEHQFVGIEFVANARRLRLARIELGRPSQEELMAVWQTYKEWAQLSHEDAVRKLAAETKGMIAEQLAELTKKIKELTERICLRIQTVSRRQQICISVPATPPMEVDATALYINPEYGPEYLRALIDYVTGTKCSFMEMPALCKKCLDDSGNPGKIPAGKIRVSNTMLPTIQDIKDVEDQIQNICTWMRGVEAYHKKMIECMNSCMEKFRS